MSWKFWKRTEAIEIGTVPPAIVASKEYLDSIRDETKICKDCKYTILEECPTVYGTTIVRKCIYKATRRIDLVNGTEYFEGTYTCSYQRGSLYPEDCGPQGQFYDKEE